MANGKQCIDLNIPDIQLPGILIGPPTIPSIPAFGAEFCCKFSLRPTAVNEVVNAANATIALAFAGTMAVLNAPIMALNEGIAVALAAAREIKNQLPKCPLDSSDTNVSI